MAGDPLKKCKSADFRRKFSRYKSATKVLDFPAYTVKPSKAFVFSDEKSPNVPYDPRIFE